MAKLKATSQAGRRTQKKVRTPRPDVALQKRDYEVLAAFRLTLRRFLGFTERGAREAGITPQQHQLLLAIRGTPGREWSSVRELADALQVHHHGAVGLVDRSERAGLVTRRRDPIDRRLVRVRATARGRRILAALSARNRRELWALRRALQVERLATRAPRKRKATASAAARHLP